MTNKKFCLGMLLMALAFTMTVAGCGNKKPGLDKTEADRPVWVNDLPPEDALWGIGVAKTESDGESILLAEDRARTDIARQLAAKVYSIMVEDQYDITQATTSTFLIGSRVIRRYKDKNGAWWCLVQLPKANANLSGSKPAQDDIAATLQSDMEILRSNMENWPDIKNAVTLDDIPGWVFDAGPEDVICGAGAAKLGNDEEAVYLAMERARRSLARSLSAEINAVFSDYYVSESESYQEEGVSITSVYEYTPMQTLLLNQAKTKDGTFWIMLGKTLTVQEIKQAVPSGKLVVPPMTSFNAEERMNQAFERINEETQR